MSVPIQLDCLGTVRLVDAAGKPLDAVLAQPKRLGLFAYLLLADDAAKQPRDALLGMFWADSMESDARAALRQALSYLRRELGADVIVGGGRRWVGVDRNLVTCDLWTLETHLECGKEEAALELYRGELLQGLELRGSREFDRWLTTRRRALARRMAGVAGDLAERARNEDDAAMALVMARRALEIVPSGEEELRRLMGIQLWAGDRAGALRTYERFERWLRDEYGAMPSARTRALAERARGPAPRQADAAPDPQEDVAEAVASETPLPSGAQSPQRLLAWRSLARLAVVVIAVLGSLSVLALASSGRSPANATTDVERVLILPFDVRSTDPRLVVLRDGMVDVLAAVFTGRPGPRAMGTAMPGGRGESVTDAEAERRARRTEARWLITGEVLGDDRRVLLQASLKDLTGATGSARASLSGPADSVYALARELGSRLLALSAGASEAEAIRLGRVSPDALEAYLLGRSAYGAGRYEAADEHFRTALRHDSLFAQAAAGLVETHLGAPWLHGHVFKTALPLAFRLRDRLGSADREIVTAVAGPAYPQVSTYAEHYRAWERAVRQTPDRTTVWYQWGDALYHVGPFLGLPDHRERARAAFLRTLELDTTYLIPLAHLIELAADDGDAGEAEVYLERLLEPGRDPGNADYLRWRVARAADDEAALERLRARFHQFNVASLKGIVINAQFTAEGLEDAEQIARRGPIGRHRPAERLMLLETLHTYALNRGRPAEARAIVESMAAAGSTGTDHLALALQDHLIAGGDSALALAAAERLAEHVRREGALEDRCMLEAWKLWRGDTSTIDASLRAIDGAIAEARQSGDRRPLWCRTFLRGIRSLDGDPGDRRQAATDLQHMVREGEIPPGTSPELLHVVTARALEGVGDLEGALAVTRLYASVPYALATRLRHRGRLAARLGDTTAALAAYEHYMRLREDPEPALTPERDYVLGEYLALGGRYLASR